MGDIINFADEVNKMQPIELNDDSLVVLQQEADEAIVDLRNSISLQVGECVVASRQLATYVKDTFEEVVELKSPLKVVAIERNSVRSTGEKGKRVHALLETKDGRRYSIPSRIANTLKVFKDASEHC